MDKVELKLSDGGKLVARLSPDEIHPGIWIEYENESLDDSIISPPAVLVECHEGKLRALVWANPQDEDYTYKTDFDI